jgi:hypothetical protein
MSLFYLLKLTDFPCIIIGQVYCVLVLYTIIFIFTNIRVIKKKNILELVYNVSLFRISLAVRCHFMATIQPLFIIEVVVIRYMKINNSI